MKIMNTRLAYVKKKKAKYKLLIFQGVKDTINHIQEITLNIHNNVIIQLMLILVHLWLHEEIQHNFDYQKFSQ